MKKNKTNEGPGRPKKAGGKRYSRLRASQETWTRVKKLYGSVEAWGQEALERTGVIKKGEDY